MDAFADFCLSRTTRCNPVAQTGCLADEKCTWIRYDAGRGALGCVPDQPPTKACAFGPDGETTGYDNCAAGDICIDGVCQAICVSSPDSCQAPATCALHEGIFCATDLYGACAPP